MYSTMRKIWEVNVYDANFVYYRIQLFYCNIEVSTHVLCFEIIHLIIGVQVSLPSCGYKICQNTWNSTHHVPIQAKLDKLYNGEQLMVLDIRTGRYLWIINVQ